MHKDQVEGKMEIVKQIQKIFAIDEKGLPLEYKMRKTGVVITELVAEARTPDNVMETAAQLGLSMEDTLRAIVSGYLSENVLGLSQDKLKHSLTDFAKLMSKYFSENHHVVDLVLKQVQSLVYGGQVEMAKTTDVIDALLFYGKITTGMVDDWTTKEDTTNKSLTGDEQDLWKAFKKQIEIGTGDYKPQPANELSVLENHKPLTRATTGKQVTQPNKGKSGFARPTAATIAMRKAPPSQLTGINRNPTFSTQRRVAPTVVHSSTGGRSTMTAVGGATQLGDGGATEAVSVRPMSTEATPIGFPKPHPGAKSAAGSHIDFGAQEKRTNTNSFDKMNTMKQSARGGVSTGTTGGASRPGGAYTKTTNSTAKTAPASSGSTMRAAGGAKPAAGRRDDSTDVDTHDNRGAKNAK